MNQAIEILTNVVFWILIWTTIITILDLIEHRRLDNPYETMWTLSLIIILYKHL